MDGMRRYWIGMGLAGVLAAGAVLTARPVLLVGAAMIGASLLAYQYVFVRTLARTVDHLDVEEATSHESVVADETTVNTLHVRDRAGSPLELTVEAQPPIAARTSGDQSVRLGAGKREARTSFEVTWPVAGSFRFDAPHLHVADQYGLFRTRLPIEPRVSPSITVEPGQPQEMHVGSGGERLLAAYGEHEMDITGSGIEPDVLREYTTADAANRIDWKTTARLSEPFVREYESETDHETALLIDTRDSMSQGPSSGETKLDYARQIALALTENAREFNDPLGLYIVTDDGLADRVRPASHRQQYVSIRERIQELEPTENAADSSQPHQTSTTMRQASTHLTDDSAFASRLQPYLEETASHVQRIDRDPLFGTVRSYIRLLHGSIWTVIITDDTHRAELREAVMLARRGNDQVLVFLAPTVLFEEGGLADVGNAYERYLDFERFRKQLATIHRVSAFEMGPGDRLDTVLSSGAHEHRRTRTATPSSPNL
ncbi:DUF58 domain-containing protein [Halalkalicoccus salilacus]|uniref:DUF58 domain-containing protein n=1 Tax=Halalkalicoccus salilacus TaxID=3117459 RepID=UPI00300EA39C